MNVTFDYNLEIIQDKNEMHDVNCKLKKGRREGVDPPFTEPVVLLCFDGRQN